VAEYIVGETLGVGEFFKVKGGTHPTLGRVALKFGKLRSDQSICTRQAEQEVVRCATSILRSFDLP